MSSKIGWIKKRSLALKILKGIALTGVVLVAASNPYFGLYLIKNIQKDNNKKAWRRFYQSLNYLKRRGYVSIIDDIGDQLKVKITRKGETIIELFDIESLQLPKPGNWDGKWRLIIFDVPISKNKNRLAFREKIKELGFIMIQKSVWAYPFGCYKEVMLLRKFYEIEKYVTYLEVVEVEDEFDWRAKFNFRETRDLSG